MHGVTEMESFLEAKETGRKPCEIVLIQAILDTILLK